jgi:hypothetical protein
VQRSRHPSQAGQLYGIYSQRLVTAAPRSLFLLQRQLGLARLMCLFELFVSACSLIGVERSVLFGSAQAIQKPTCSVEHPLATQSQEEKTNNTQVVCLLIDVSTMNILEVLCSDLSYL